MLRISEYSSIPSFTLQIDKLLGFVIRNMKHFHEELTLQLLFSALVLSKLYYASIISSRINNDQISLLEDVQRKFFKSAILFMDGSYPTRGTPSEQLCHRFRSYSLGSRMFKSSPLCQMTTS